MIVVEGPDGAGKTTLVEHLAKELKLKVRTRQSTSVGGPRDDLLAWMKEDMASWREAEPGILDRIGLISEPIYGPVCRGRVQWGETDLDELSGLFSTLHYQALVIFCLPPLEVVKANVLRPEVKQMPGVKDNIASIHAMYTVRAADMMSMGHADIYDYTKDDPALGSARPLFEVTEGARAHVMKFRRIQESRKRG